MEPAAPKNINKYDVIGLIGRGGMGVVYKAIDRSLNRLVAIKMVTNTEDEHGEALKRFNREAQFTANLRHQNIVTVYELGEFQGNPYLVMEYLAGQSLDSMLAHQPMTLLQKLNYVRQVCTGLHYAHTRKPSIIHRDIKPANIVVVEDGTIKIVDFGIARLGQSRNTRSGQLMGSYHYMSPEQINDAELDGRTDIFSTGVVLYQLLTLTLPFEGSGIAQTLNRICHTPPPPLSQFLKQHPPELDEIVCRALAKNLSDRYQTANDFAFDLLDVEEKLKRELFGEYLDQAEICLARNDFDGARQQLSEVLKVDSQHARANELMRQVQQAAARRQRKDRARDLRVHAERAIELNRLAEAVESLDQAVKLDNSNTELQAYREQVIALHQQAERLNEVLSRAERASAANDLDGAARAVDEALQLDPESSRAKSFKTIVDGKLAARENERQLQLLLDDARRQIASQKFGEALQLLQDAEALNPTNPDIRNLLTAAENGYREQSRQRALEKAAAEINNALTRSEPSLARNLAAAALERFPDNPGILELLRLAERQVESRKREKALAAIRALLSAGEYETAERQVTILRPEFRNAPELRDIEDQIRAARALNARQEVERSLREAQDLVRFEAESQAVETLDGTAHLLEFVPEALRESHRKLRDEIEQKRARQPGGTTIIGGRGASPETPYGREWQQTGAVPNETAPTPRSSARDALGSDWAAVARKKQNQEHTVAELTPAEGISLPDLGADAITADLVPKPPAPGAQVPSSSTLSSSMPDANSPASAAASPEPAPSLPSQTFSAGQTQAWPDSILRQVEEQLAVFIGPLAKIVVRKTACRTNDPEEFYRLLAEKIESRIDRQAFMSRRVPIGPGARNAPFSSVQPPTSRPADTGISEQALKPELVARGARLLAPYVGPIAAVLAKKASQRASNARAFFGLLSEHIEGEDERDRFLRDAGFPQ